MAKLRGTRAFWIFPSASRGTVSHASDTLPRQMPPIQGGDRPTELKGQTSLLLFKGVTHNLFYFNLYLFILLKRGDFSRFGRERPLDHTFKYPFAERCFVGSHFESGSSLSTFKACDSLSIHYRRKKKFRA